MGTIRAAVATAFTLLALTGCTAAAAPDIKDGGQSEADGVAALAPPTDEEMCWDYADVVTLVGNMKSANNEGRLIGNEWDGITRLAARMVDNIDVDTTTDVGAALAAQQDSIQDAHGGAMSRPDQELIDAWTSGPANDPVQAACYASLTEWGVEGWVGG